ncbi:hypothetical protein BH23GEM3_BH23GEM3_11840 [soil metagenome]
MRCARRVLLVLILTCGGSFPLQSQSQDSRGPPLSQQSRGFRLEQNYPNPVNPETWIPFFLEEELFAEADSAVVSLRIVNQLRQTIAIPIAVEHPRGRDLQVTNLSYRSAGRQVAYWDGRDTAGRLVRSGVYYYQMVIDDHRPLVGKLIVLNPRRRSNIVPWFGGNKRDRPE